MRTIIAAAVVLAVAATGAVAAQKGSREGATFAKKVAAANAFEIQSSRLATERARSADVKSFAQQMITDHTKIGDDLKSAVQAANISPPPPERLDRKERSALVKLRKLHADAFDRAYANGQLQGHKQAVALFQRYAKSGRTQPLKEFAQKTLPTLEQHLEKAKELTSQMGIAAGRRLSPPAGYRPEREMRR